MTTDIDDAHVLVDRIIGGLPAAPRRALLECFAKSILLAQAARPGGWALTVPRRKRILRLSVGWVEMLSLYPDELTVTVSGRPPKTLARMYSRGPYLKVPEQGFIRVPLRHADVVRRAYRLAREIHEAAVRSGAREQLTPTLRRAHVPAVVELLRQELRVDLPESWTLDPVDEIAMIAAGAMTRATSNASSAATRGRYPPLPPGRGENRRSGRPSLRVWNAMAQMPPLGRAS